MSVLAAVGIVAAGYLGIVVAVESLVGYIGRRLGQRGVQAGETWLQITATVEGADRSVVVAGVESAGRTYVAANHWPRAWYRRVVENPDVRVTVQGRQAAFRAVPVSGDERSRIEREYRLPLIVRILTGFPPRAFLRLDPVAPEPAP
ncbi:MAG: nitroreductase family deazaflavin-dependent oxidoreductase [Acidobacteria bacterium]|nr:nitroreductase family deazaflavin-dependent oxidoreductase [Acidobacteriota bacterium]